MIAGPRATLRQPALVEKISAWRCFETDVFVVPMAATPKHFFIIPWILLVVSMCFIYMGVKDLYGVSAAYLWGEQAQGQVTQTSAAGRTRSTTYYYTIEYQDARGTLHTATSSDMRPYEVGQHIEVVYSPGTPSKVYLPDVYLYWAADGLGYITLALFIALFGFNELSKALAGSRHQALVNKLLAIDKSMVPLALMLTVIAHLAGKPTF